MSATTLIAILSLLVLAAAVLLLLNTSIRRSPTATFLIATAGASRLGSARVAFLVGGPFAIEAVSVYLGPLLPSPDGARDADRIEDYRGLLQTRPALSVAFAASLLSLAGIPLTVVFIAKFYAVASGVNGHHPVLLGTPVAGSILGLCCYLRSFLAMATSAARTAGSRRGSVPALGGAVLAALVLLLIGLSAYPAPPLTLIRATAAMVAH